MLATALLVLAAAAAAAADAAADADGDLLPYPRSAVPTGQGGDVFVISLANISDHADQVRKAARGPPCSRLPALPARTLDHPPAVKAGRMLRSVAAA